MPQQHSTPLLRRLVRRLMLPALLSAALALVVLAPQPAEAASGGRIGGGSFRSAPMPRSYSGGGYGGGGYQRGYGGGIGFPFIVPFFFGGGGLFGFLVLMAVVGLVLNAFRGSGGGAGGQALPAGMRGGDLDGYRPDGPVAIAQLQVGLLASARELQRDLRSLAASSDTSSSSGLQRVLQDSTLALLRHPDLWVYANAEVGQVPFQAAESTFNRLSMTERSKLAGEITTNVGGSRGVASSSGSSAGDADATSDYIAVTVLVASRSRITLKPLNGSEDLREALRVVGSVPSDQLLALEVIWQPEGVGEVLSADELITAYPDLKHL